MERILDILGTAGIVAVVIALFSLAVFVHEFGHFLAARLLGFRVDAFSIGFGPAIWKWKKGGVEYKICWILFGGYVALPQLDPSGMDKIQGKNKESAEKGEAAAAEAPPPPVAAWKRLVVAAAGPFGNVVFAIAIAFVLPFADTRFGAADSTVDGVLAGSPADMAGIWPGDKILSINGRTTEYFNDVITETAIEGASALKVDVARAKPHRPFGIIHEKFDAVSEAAGGTVYTQKLDIAVLAVADDGKHAGDAATKKVARRAETTVSSIAAGTRGIKPEGSPFAMPEWNGTAQIEDTGEGGMPETFTVQVTPANMSGRPALGLVSTRQGAPSWMMYRNPAKQLLQDCSAMFRVLGALATPKTSGATAKAVSGPVGIGRVLYKTVREDFWGALGFLRFLCMNLALINILPLPVLDGGHIVFALFEILTGRKPNRKFVDILTNVFAVLLLGLMALLVFTDSKRWVDSATAAEAPAAGTLVEYPAPAETAK